MIQLQPIIKINKVFYSGTVYNLELESKTNSIEKEDQYFIDADSGVISHNCFPKDLAALIYEMKRLGVPSPLLQAVWNRNTNTDRQIKNL